MPSARAPAPYPVVISPAVTTTGSAGDREPDPDEDPRTQARLGSVLDEKWTLERVLGSGGMGAVYAGRHRNGARGAVKVLHPELARRSDVRERFLREGYAANRVEHRGAVQVLDDDIIKEGPDEGTAYLVMEILEGESLEERLDRGPPLTEIELLVILDDVLAVLEAAHAHGVVHRDLKPANLFLNADANGHGVKVLDFGLARLAEARSGTSAGLALGTPSFMAPEQASGRQDEIDARSDLFAIGATAFMILANRGVHEAAGVIELVARMGTLPAPKLRDVAPQVSEGVAKIVDRALEFERDDRYPSATAMRADVLKVLDALRNPPVTVIARAPVAEALIAASEPPPPSAGPSRGGSRAWMLLAMFLVAGVALIVFVPRARTETNAALDQFLARPSASPGDPAAPASAPAPAAASAPPREADAALPMVAAPDPVVDASIEDAAADAADDEDDDDDDVDASDVAAISSSASGSAAHPGPAIARPHAPTLQKKRLVPGKRHGKGKGKRKKGR